MEGFRRRLYGHPAIMTPLFGRFLDIAPLLNIPLPNILRTSTQRNPSQPPCKETTTCHQMERQPPNNSSKKAILLLSKFVWLSQLRRWQHLHYQLLDKAWWRRRPYSTLLKPMPICKKPCQQMQQPPSRRPGAPVTPELQVTIISIHLDFHMDAFRMGDWKSGDLGPHWD